MRVAYVCADRGVPVFGSKGASVHVQEVVRAFLRRGDEVTVYCVRRGDLPPDDLRHVRVVEIAADRSSDPGSRERATAAAAHRIADAVVADGCDLVYERYALFSTASADIARRTAAAAVLEVNSPLVEEQRTHRELVDAAGAVTATRTAIAGADVVACVSEPVADWVREMCPTERGAVVVAPNGVNTNRIRDGRSPTPGVFTVGFVGTLKPWHGVEHLLHAVARARETTRARRTPGDQWRLVVAGDGPERDRLERLADRLGLEVEFTGALAPADVPAVLARFDVGVAPYPPGLEQYFSPLKVFEYLSAGLPVVASATGQLPSIVEHGRVGLLVAPGDVPQLAAALTALHDDEPLRRRLGAAGRAQAVGRHDWTGVLDGILAAAPLDHLERSGIA